MVHLLSSEKIKRSFFFPFFSLYFYNVILQLFVILLVGEILLLEALACKATVFLCSIMKMVGERKKHL